MKFEEYLKLAERFNPQNVLDDIAYLGRFHRIQGSKELADAANYIFQNLKDMRIDSRFIVEYYTGEGTAANMSIPIAWEPGYGKIEIGDKMLTTEQTPLAVMAHSPPGKASGKLIPVENESSWDSVKGKIVLVGENWRENYRRACERGAKGFVIYRKGLGDAVPYVGLFLTRKDLEWAKIPAMAIPETWAREFIARISRGEKVRCRMEVKSKIKDREVLPIIYATIGKPPYILFSAHLCHPRPGANDNASGSAMLLELARILKDSYDESHRFGYAFLWIPEHIGTGLFAEKHAKMEDYYGVINLDMVGGENIVFIRTPLSRFSLLSPVVETFLSIQNSKSQDFAMNMPILKLSSSPYAVGSDHDIFNFFGVPAVMVITWPYRYYHSSQDSVDKLSIQGIDIIGKAVLAASLFLSKEKLAEFARAARMHYLGELAMKRRTKIAPRLVDAGLKRDAGFFGFRLGRELKKKPWLTWVKRGLIIPEMIKDEKRKKKMKELYKTRERAVLLHELIMLGELLDERSCKSALIEEYGEVEWENLRELINILIEEGIVKLN